MKIHRSVLPTALLLAVSFQAAAVDNAAIQEWARQKMGPQMRLMPEIQQKTVVTQAGPQSAPVDSAESAQNQPAAPAGAIKRATVCNSNSRLGDNTVFYCGAFGNERMTVQSLTAKGWRIVSVWPWRDELQLLAEER